GNRCRWIPLRPRRAARRAGLPACRPGVSSIRARLRVPWTTCGCGESGPPCWSTPAAGRCGQATVGDVARPTGRRSGLHPRRAAIKSRLGRSPDLQGFRVPEQGGLFRLRQLRAEQVAAVAVVAAAGVVAGADALGFRALADEADIDRVVEVVAAPEH